MSLRVFNSIAEALVYGLLIVMIIFNIIELNQIHSLASQDKKGIEQVETQVQCIAAYFNMLHRTGNTTLNCRIKP